MLWKTNENAERDQIEMIALYLLALQEHLMGKIEDVVVNHKRPKKVSSAGDTYFCCYEFKKTCQLTWRSPKIDYKLTLKEYVSIKEDLK